MTISTADLEAWRRDGFLIVRGAVAPEQLEAVVRTVDAEWQARAGNDHMIDILSGERIGESLRLADASPDLRRQVHKLNNLFLRRETVREAAFAPRLRAALETLLEGEPLICNSLNFERGSQQPFHLDTWYMPPPVEDRMVAVNIAIDPMTSTNGPFVYYPGSHLIDYYRFSSGHIAAVDGELHLCAAYMQAELERLGLKAETAVLEPGDAFIWHARLYHGGAPILDPDATRRSLVVHYWRADDLEAGRVRSDANGAYLRQTLRGELAPA
ncbi:phytanoyl-CoA dioxygenase family protein [Brevundimonas sp.]|uniref:phytanoyl-CoA dioxygenase family protein n=1 Tax=Brevundimonas sp. TaxID=1871086 RepID=UPI0022C1FD64|nr:phytanoyl-CoA dioxygenase family protein [Brevundimonas sp.]MCZ8194867.1 phytanoyl-CoA dioxygenase family protein [Brevundimonas sp.]